MAVGVQRSSEKREYLQRATAKRKQESENYQAYQEKHNPSEFHVYPKANPAKTQEPRPIESGDAVKYRTVFATPEAVFCDCEDFNNQASYLSQHPYLWHQIIKQYQICKHALATLGQIGFSSLSDYLRAWKASGRLNNLAVTMNRTTRARSA